jgi:pimeloyl-ACP methyl ester carboxylesterase
MVALGLLSAAASAQARTLGEIEFEPCVLTSAGLPRPTEAQCATVTVPENPADPEGRKIDLALAWIPVESEAEPDPVFLIAGGPGQSARESYPAVAPAFADINRSRHILLLDQRGTGGSNLLACPMDEEDQATMALEDLASEQVRELTQACIDELEEKADLRYYSTREAVFDLEFVRQALGAEQINLVGVSYGTRVAQQYAKDHPDRVRSIILDSVVPPGLALGSEHARNLEDALETHFQRCRETPACAEALGDPDARLDELAARLRSGGLEPVRYRDPTSGEWREEVPTYGHLAAILRMYSYSPLTAAVLPLVVQRASAGDYAGLMAMARMLVGDLGGQIAMGMHNSVMCTEEAADLQVRPEDEGTILGAQLVEFMVAQCELWPRGERPDNFRDALAGDLPVLLLSGEYDPVTPPRYGDEVAATLENARHLVLPGQGHSLMSTGCMPKLAAQFLESADPAALDASCLERLAAPPPFSGMYGWEP